MKRVLFVDDEQHLLEGLKRLLRAQRKEWEMSFAISGEEALSVMEKGPIDVVVTDMRMPGMDGAALLERIHARFPRVMRIVLSGHFDIEAGLRAVPVAHQFLMKPCDPGKLRAAIERSSHLGAVVPDETAKCVIGAVGSLPSPPRTCAMLLELIGDPASSMQAIGRIIDHDVALAAKLLQLANSAFFNLPHEVTDVKGALNVLGMDVLKQLILSAEILKQFHPAQPVRGFSMEDFDLHSRLTAQISGILPTNPEFVPLRTMTGLLHDAGKLILATRMAPRFERSCALAASGVPLHVAEQQEFGTSHAEIGAYLLDLWGIQRVAVDAIAAHHRPPESIVDANNLSLTETIHIASALAHDCLEASPATPFPRQLEPSYLEGSEIATRWTEWRTTARGLLEKARKERL